MVSYDVANASESGLGSGSGPGSRPGRWREEIKILGRASCPLILTYVLQYSITVIGLAFVGRLGNTQLAAVSLGSMTANITGYAAYQGLATGLDTLCAQAYGSGNKKLVGIHLQRMTCFLWMVTIPIGMVWWNSETLLRQILVDEEETVHLASIYLKILLLGAPGWAAFECGKRFLQAQGIFAANLHILIVLAPVNAILQWFLIWPMGLGFVGSPIAVSITNNLLPLSLVFYVYALGRGKNCWLTPSWRRVFTDWGPMIQLAVPGFVMLLSEWIAFEILTLWAGMFGSSYLAAQGTLISLANLGAQVSIPVAIAASIRVANLIGAGEAQHARLAAKAAVGGAIAVGLLNMGILLAGQKVIPGFFSLKDDARVLAEQMLPFVAAFQLLDTLNTCSQGLLRGTGSQRVGGYVALVVINGVALPLSYVAGFRLQWRLLGLWAGPIFAVFIVLAICGPYLYLTNWDRAVEEARLRAPLVATAES